MIYTIAALIAAPHKRDRLLSIAVGDGDRSEEFMRMIDDLRSSEDVAARSAELKIELL